MSSTEGKEEGATMCPKNTAGSQRGKARKQGPRVKRLAKIDTDDTLNTFSRGPGGGRECIVAGDEVIGRAILLFTPKSVDGIEGVIKEYDAARQMHLVKYQENMEAKDGVKNEEEWVELRKHRFKWMSEPGADAAPHPSYADGPKGEKAIGTRVKVYWPGMAKWYVGKVFEYDDKDSKYTIKYKDGDVQRLNLKHEAVVYLKRAGRKKILKTEKNDDAVVKVRKKRGRKEKEPVPLSKRAKVDDKREKKSARKPASPRGTVKTSPRSQKLNKDKGKEATARGNGRLDAGKRHHGEDIIGSRVAIHWVKEGTFFKVRY